MPKTEAQIRNEKEVRRIMAERGYSPASNKRKARKTFSSNFPLKSILVGVFVIGLLIGGGILLQNNPFEKPQKNNNTTTKTTSSKIDYELAEFQACLKAIDTSDIAIDDAEFWNKHINRYEQTISCYDNHPSVANPSKKEGLQNKLTELRDNYARVQNNLEQAEANAAAYKANMAKIDAELGQNLAKIKEESDAWDAELLERVRERQAQSDEKRAQYAEEQAAKEQQAAALEAQRQQEQAEKEAQCNDYKSTYGEKSATEIAESDPEVTRAKYDWTKAQKKIKDCSGGNIVYNQSQRELCNSYRDQEVQKAESLHSVYTNLLQQKNAYYRNLKIEACGY